MDDDLNHYHSIDVELFRRKVIEKAGQNLKRNRSPVQKVKRQPSTSNEHHAETSAFTPEAQYAVPEQRYRSQGSASGYRSPPDGYVDPRAISCDVRSGARLPCGGYRSGTAATDSPPRRIFFDSFDGESTFDRRQRSSLQRHSASPHHVGTENYWLGQRLATKELNSKTPMIKNYWEANVQRDEKQKAEATAAMSKKAFGFPRWRSNDALTASLVASKGRDVEIPRDSKIPAHRLQRLDEIERQAVQDKATIQQQAEPPKKLQKGKSLDSLTMQLDYQPWYDKKQIREGISRESIANLGATKDKFEAASPTKELRHSESSEPSSRFESPHPPPPPPPKTEQGRLADSTKDSNGYGTLDPDRGRKYFDGTSMHGERQMSSGELHRPDRRSDDSRVNLTSEQQLFLLFVKQNVDLVGGLGIMIPDGLKVVMNEIPWRKVEMRAFADDDPRRQPLELKSYQPRAYAKDYQGSPVMSPSNHSQQSSAGAQQNGFVTGGKGGRYVKNTAPVNMNHRVMSRRTYDITPKQIPENKRPIMQQLDREKAGDSLIAAEIRMLRDREEELKRSRSELGLPSLEDTMELWRNGYNTRPMNPLRSAVSYDHLHQAVQPLPKSGSIEHLHHVVNESSKNHYEKSTKAAHNDFAHKQHSSESYGGPSRAQHGKSVAVERPLQIGEVTVTKDYVGQRNSQFRVAQTNNVYKLHKCDDPDVMIYGPSTRRQNGSAEVLHVAGNTVTAAPGIRTARYE